MTEKKTLGITPVPSRVKRSAPLPSRRELRIAAQAEPASAPAAKSVASGPPSSIGGFGDVTRNAPAPAPVAAPVVPAAPAEPVPVVLPPSDKPVEPEVLPAPVAATPRREIPAWLREEVLEGDAAEVVERVDPVHSSVLDGYNLADRDSIFDSGVLREVVRAEASASSEVGMLDDMPTSVRTTGSLGTAHSMVLPTTSVEIPTFTGVLMGIPETDEAARVAYDPNNKKAHELVGAPSPYEPVSAFTTASNQRVSVLPEDSEDERDRAIARGKGKPVVRKGGTAVTERKVEPFAVVGFVMSIVGFGVLSLLAVLCGHTALGRMKTHGTRGRGLATAALVLGYVGLILVVLAGLVVFWAQQGPEPLILAPGEDWNVGDLTGIRIEATK